jgi:hypothetical protein
VHRRYRPRHQISGLRVVEFCPFVAVVMARTVLRQEIPAQLTGLGYSFGAGSEERFVELRLDATPSLVDDTVADVSGISLFGDCTLSAVASNSSGVSSIAR